MQIYRHAFVNDTVSSLVFALGDSVARSSAVSTRTLHKLLQATMLQQLLANFVRCA